MTVCIAAIQQERGDDRIITVSDKKLSVLGGAASIEGVSIKSELLCRDWFVLFSGDTSPIVPLLQALKTAAINCKQSGELRSFARCLSGAYRAEREKLIENEILSNYDIDSFAAYLAAKGKEQDLFDAITSTIHQAEEGWSFLVCGFDCKQRAHVFVLGERGKIQYCDIDSFAAIGSGGYAAYIAMCSYPYNRRLSIEEASWSILAAKFAAESAEGVGEEAHFMVSIAKHDLSVTLNNKEIEAMRKKWKALPRIPKGVKRTLSGLIREGIEELPQVESEHRHIRSASKTPRKPKLSASQTLEGQQ